MNQGDDPENQREYNSEEVNNLPKEENLANEPVKEDEEEFEYVDEDGNPIDPKEMDEYEVVEEDDEEPLEEDQESEEELEYVDEDGNPIDPKEMDEYEVVDDEDKESEEEFEYVDEPEKNQQTTSEEESEEILNDIKDISGIPMEQLRERTPSRPEQKQEIQEQKIEQPSEPIQQPTLEPEPVQQPVMQADTIQEEVIRNEPKEEDLEFKRKEEELIRTISTGKKPEETDIDIFIRNAQDAQQNIEGKDSPPVQQPIVQAEPIQEKVIRNEPKQETQIQEEENEDLLQKLSMKQQPAIIPEENNNEDSIKDPYIYRKGHPHIGSNFNMSTISNLAKRIFNTDEASDRLNKAKKKKF